MTKPHAPFLMACLLLVSLLRGADGKVFESEIISSKGFAFVGKFAFGHVSKDSSEKWVGFIDVNVTIDKVQPAETPPLDILLFDDEHPGWDMVYDRGYRDISCGLMRTYAKNWDAKENRVEDPHLFAIDMHEDTNKAVKVRITEHQRDRFWFVAIANCEPFSGVKVKTTFINTLAAVAERHFPVNEEGIRGLFIEGVLVFSILLCASIYNVYRIWSKDNYVHHILKILNIALFAQWLSVLVNCCHYVVFGKDGKGLPTSSHFATSIDAFATTVFMFMLLLLAQGWTIKTTRLTGRNFILGCCASFLILRWVVLIYSIAIEDPAATEVPAFYQFMLYLTTIVWLGFAGAFCVLTYRSWKGEPVEDKKTLFKRLGIVYGVWIISLPLTVLITLDVAPWARDKAVFYTHLLLTQAAYAVMILLMWHSRVGDYFETSVPVVAYDRVNSHALADMEINAQL